MIKYSLPTSVFVDGKEYPINENGDFRLILDILSALSDDNFTSEEKITCALSLFYNYNVPENILEAYKSMIQFIDCGKSCEQQNTSKPLMSWEHDFDLIIPAVNKSMGKEVRAVEYLHWWTFYDGYMEISKDSTFSYIVNIRYKKNNNIPLDKSEQKYYEKNRGTVDLPIEYYSEEKEFFDKLLGGDT